MKTETKERIINGVVIALAVLLIIAVPQVQHKEVAAALAELQTTVDDREEYKATIKREQEMAQYWKDNAVAMGDELTKYQTLFSEAAIRIREYSNRLGVAALIPE